MNVETYVFQSPYPSAVQVGRPDPQAQKQEDTAREVDAIATAGNETLREAQGFKAQQSTGASVNVAASSSDSGVSGSLEEFSTLNAQSQAVDAYKS